MSSFDVTSFFANAMLDKTIKIILKSVYEKKEIVTTIPKREKKKILCTKNVPFSFNNPFPFYQSVLAYSFMVELERTSYKIKLSKRYGDDTITFIMKSRIFCLP